MNLIEGGPFPTIAADYTDVWVDNEEAERLLRILDNDTVHVAAMLVSNRFLFSEPIKVDEEEEEEDGEEGEEGEEKEEIDYEEEEEDDGKKRRKRRIEKSGKKKKKKRRIKGFDRPSSSIMQKIAQKYYIPEIQNFGSRHLVAIGYLVWTIVWKSDPLLHTEEAPFPVPVIRRPCDYRLKFRNWSDGSREVLIYLKGKNEPVNDHFVFFMPECMPDSETGKHHSYVAQTQSESNYLRQMFEAQVVAHKQRSHPPVVIEPLPPNQMIQPGGVQMMGFANPFSMEEKESELTKLQNDAATKSLVTQTLLEQRKRLRGEDQITDDDNMVTDPTGNGGTKKFRQTIIDNRHEIPDGFKVAATQPPLPEAQTDLLQWRMEHVNQVCIIHGIPPNMMYPSSRSGATGQNGGNAPLAEEDTKNFATMLRGRNNHHEELVKQMYESVIWFVLKEKKKSDLRFTMDMIPFTTPRIVQGLFEQAVVSEDARNDTLLKLTGFRESHKAGRDHRVRRPPINGSENMTDQSMEDNHDIKKAEAAKIRAEEEKIRKEMEGGGKEGLEIKLMEMQIELERVKIEGQKEIIQMKLEAERQKLEIDKQRNEMQLDHDEDKLEMDKEKLTFQNKAAKEKAKIQTSVAAKKKKSASSSS